MERKYKVAIIINAIVVCVGLICAVIPAINFPFSILSVIEIVMYLLICFYAFVGYKKPHGNLLRYLMFAFGLMLISRIYVCSFFLHELTCLIFYAVSIALIAYISGRLNKIEKNRFLAVLVLLLLCHCGHAQRVAGVTVGIPTTFVDRVATYGPAFMWIALSSAYFTRFLQHKEAGLTDTPSK